MPNENPDDQTDETTDPADIEADATDEPNEPNEGDEPNGDEPAGDDSQLSHKDALEALTETRAEAANYRVKLRDAEAKLSDALEKLSKATTPEAIEDLKGELEQTVAKNEELAREILVRDIAKTHKLTDELAEVIRDLAESGKSEDDLNTRAEALAKLVPSQRRTPENLGGGLDPSDEDTTTNDPAKLRELAPRRRR